MVRISCLCCGLACRQSSPPAIVPLRLSVMPTPSQSVAFKMLAWRLDRGATAVESVASRHVDRVCVSPAAAGTSTDSCRHLHHQPHNCRPQLCRQSSSPPPWLPRPSALPTSGRSVLSCSRRVSVLRGEACTSSRDCCSPPPPPPPAGTMAHRAAAVVCDAGVESVGRGKDACLAS